MNESFGSSHFLHEYIEKTSGNLLICHSRNHIYLLMANIAQVYHTTIILLLIIRSKLTQANTFTNSG